MRRGIAVPTLVVSRHRRQRDARGRLPSHRRAIPGARYEPIPGAGHACYIEAPGPFDAAVLRFIGAA